VKEGAMMNGGDPAGLFERLPRPAFSEVCSIV
jgi:hypothetical protein